MSAKKPKTSGKKPFVVMTRKAVAGWACAAFLLCGWMFGLGVWVGRGTVPLKFDTKTMQAEIQLPPPAGEADETDAESGRETAPDSTELDFFENLKKDRQDTRLPAADPPKETAPQASSSKPAVEGPSGQKTPAVKKAAPKPAAETKQPAQRAAAPEAPGDRYTIQVASVKNQADADRLVARLKKMGFPAYRMIAKVTGKGIWFRVRVGDYGSRGDAGIVMAKLEQSGHQPMLVKK